MLLQVLFWIVALVFGFLVWVALGGTFVPGGLAVALGMKMLLQRHFDDRIG